MTDAETIAACQAELGYEDGDLLTNVKRFKAYTEAEVERLRVGGAQLVKYAQRLQELVPPKELIEAVKEAVNDKMKG